MVKNSFSQSLLGYATHYASKGCPEGNFNAYLSYTLACGGQANSKSVFYPSQTSLVPIHRAQMEERTWLNWAGKPNQESGIGCTRQQAHPTTALPRAYPMNTASNLGPSLINCAEPYD